ncbi:MAG: DUF2236 domain-containing protein [Gemmatimonadales bacterium]|nr:DUF2236 domain-containing protein [Gemmatimonadales bacterium]MYG50278.1 DUF2236 domain-containing protein [Gemmatimonadales bacterium]MYK01124.1 DUF2236 domain-containing protein [Candidatus Palauibacter ramosifaciens]
MPTRSEFSSGPTGEEFRGDATGIPTAYMAGYQRAAGRNPELARRYVDHARIVDPPADEAIRALAHFDRAEVHRFIQDGLSRGPRALAVAPAPVRHFFEQAAEPPPWLDREEFRAGREAFHRHSQLFMAAFFAVNVRQVATLISKTFLAAGWSEHEHVIRGSRRNARHFLEIMLPGSLEDHRDAWRQSVQVRLAHAQVRRLVRASGEWDETSYGAPLNAAHLGLGSASFSAGILRHVQRLGPSLDSEARASYMQLWRYVSWLVGTPEPLLFAGDEAETARFYDLALACEPPPGDDATRIAHTLVEAVTTLAGKTSPIARRSMQSQLYRVTRALIGNEVVDQLSFPSQRTIGLLPALRGLSRLRELLERWAPEMAQRMRARNLVTLLEPLTLNDYAFSLPDDLAATPAAGQRAREV